jgi:DNA-binding helix-hairpin-helix protein with protein kinase domain
MKLRLEKTGELVTIQDLPIARGGEAGLYAVAGTDALIAKLYHRPTPDRATKLTAMLANPPTDPMAARGHPSIAWPIDRLFSVEDTPLFVGYLMPRVNETRAVFSFYNPRTRRKNCPLFHYRYLIRTARNLAAAFRALHERGYVVGDVNESNVLVSETALVTVVDTDSFQVTADGIVYRCPVGKQEYTPPELQGVRFREVDRKPEHDNFGLAVIVFLLLMEGTHPFAGRYTQVGEVPTLAERIAQGHFPYSTLRRGPYEPMASAPPIGLLHPEVRNLVRQCFEVGHTHPAQRPTAADWQNALDHAENALTNCKINPQHVFRTGFGACPWCQRQQRLGGWDPFPSRDAVRAAMEAAQTPVG